MALAGFVFSAGQAEALMRSHPPGGKGPVDPTRPVQPSREQRIRERHERLIEARLAKDAQEQQRLQKKASLNVSDAPEVINMPRDIEKRLSCAHKSMHRPNNRFGGRNSSARMKKVALKSGLAGIDELSAAGEWDEEDPMENVLLTWLCSVCQVVVTVPFLKPNCPWCGLDYMQVFGLLDSNQEANAATAAFTADDSHADSSSVTVDEEWERCDASSMAGSSWIEVGTGEPSEAWGLDDDLQSQCSDTSFLLVDPSIADAACLDAEAPTATEEDKEAELAVEREPEAPAVVPGPSEPMSWSQRLVKGGATGNVAPRLMPARPSAPKRVAQPRTRSSASRDDDLDYCAEDMCDTRWRKTAPVWK